MRSSIVEWLIEQNLRHDEIGDLSRWLGLEIEKGFDPIDIFCVIEKLDGDLDMQDICYSVILEYAKLMGYHMHGISSMNVMSEHEILQRKLQSAIDTEDYEKASQIRDELIKLKKDE